MVLHRLNALELDDLLIKVGFPAKDVKTVVSPAGLYCRRSAWAKAMAESSGYYDIIGGPNPNGSYDYGLFQINDIHQPGLGPTVWAKILDPKTNAALTYKWSKKGTDWSTWGLGLGGWAGTLHDSNPSAWQTIQTVFQKWYDRYPAEIAKVKDLLPVSLVKLHPGLTNADVKTYQQALRVYLTSVNRLKNLNPSGVTGSYGIETIRMTQAVYEYKAAISGPAWLKGDLTTPGAGMLNLIGLRPI